MAKVAPKFKKVYDAAASCAMHLVIKKKMSKDDAERTVLETLKECEVYLRAGMMDLTIAVLKMTHMDLPLDKAAELTIRSYKK